MYIKFEVNEDTEEGRYFIACARLRGISPTSLFARLYLAMSKDHMVAAILDDDGKIAPKKRNEYKYSEKRRKASLV